MGWATSYIEALTNGFPVEFRPRGNSMEGLIKSGELCRVEPLTEHPKKGDIVLCKVNGRQYLHLVKATRKNSFLIGNNKGGINGWTSITQIYGIFVGKPDSE